MGSNTEKIDEPTYQTNTKDEAMRKRATSFAIAKLEEKYLNVDLLVKSNIIIAKLEDF